MCPIMCSSSRTQLNSASPWEPSSSLQAPGLTSLSQPLTLSLLVCLAVSPTGL